MEKIILQQNESHELYRKVKDYKNSFNFDNAKDNLVWFVYDIFDNNKTDEEIDREYELMKKAYQKIVLPDDFMYFCDPYHETYKFNPYKIKSVPFYPDADWCIVFDSKFNNLYIAVPMFSEPIYKYQERIFVLGKKMNDAIQKYNPPIFRKVKDSGIGLSEFVEKYGDVFRRLANCGD